MSEVKVTEDTISAACYSIFRSRERLYSSASVKRLELLLWLGRWADLGGRPPVLCLGLFGPLCDRSEFMAIGGNDLLRGKGCRKC